jgi:hypothetical protein
MLAGPREFVRDVLRVLRAPCRDHAALLSKQLDADLRPGLAFGLRLHILSCVGCRRFRTQLRVLRMLFVQLAQEPHSGQPLPPQVRERVLHHAREADKKI